MPFIDNDGISIHYQLDGNPSGTPMLLSHWFMGSHRTWYDIGWVRDLGKHFRLILVDHRGYGDSDKPHEPEAYRPQMHVSDIETLLDALEITSTHYFGYSMGGRIAYAMMAYAPQRLRSVVIGGMHPYRSERIPTDLELRISLLEQGMETTLKTYGIGPQVVFDRMMQNDPKALLADTIQTKRWEGLAEQVANFSGALLLFVGKNDGFYEGMKEFSQRIGSRFVAFPDENHRSAFLKRTLLLPHLSRFLGIDFS